MTHQPDDRHADKCGDGGQGPGAPQCKKSDQCQQGQHQGDPEHPRSGTRCRPQKDFAPDSDEGYDSEPDQQVRHDASE